MVNPLGSHSLLFLLIFRLAGVEAGDIVVDPMCGGGSIPIEAALTYPKAFHIGGDFHEKAVQRLTYFSNLPKTVSSVWGNVTKKQYTRMIRLLVVSEALVM
jgi:23S rRNA G2445 N2-methylase RlmL